MKIKGQPGFVRDTNSGAVINNDTEAYSLYIKTFIIYKWIVIL